MFHLFNNANSFSFLSCITCPVSLLDKIHRVWQCNLQLDLFFAQVIENAYLKAANVSDIKANISLSPSLSIYNRY